MGDRGGEHDVIARDGAAAVEIDSSGSQRFPTLIPMTQPAQGRQRLFPNEFDDTFPVGPEAGNSAFFGLNVLQGLVEGVDDFINERQPRWQEPYRSLEPAMLGSTRWIDDEDLLDKIHELSAACILISKQGRKRSDEKLKQLAELNEHGPGMPVQAFSALSGLAPKENGEPAIVGPWTPPYEEPFPTIRTVGFRKSRQNDSPPILHAKLALLGHLWWYEQDIEGYTLEGLAFEAKRLWTSSANFTGSSRRNMEFGYWTEDSGLLQGAERFLVKLMGSSEALDPESDLFEPELVPFEFDDEAMREASRALAELHADDGYREDEY